ncbi:MAG: type II toxin-antitoxin system HipA family toxin [Chitinivibrionales bacterium]|nr:type II toxin-antitoxin system HipA family toxin [Chitinivibrionales bacterium]
MKSLNVKIHFDDKNSYTVGRLFLSELTGKYHFEYDKSFLSAGLEISPVNLGLGSAAYLAQRNADFYDLHGVFADSLPDDWGKKVQDLEFYKIGINDPTAIDRLAFVGRYGIGALRYEPSENFEEGKNVVSLADLRKAAQKIIEGNFEAVTEELLHSGGSAGGMRPKFLVDLDIKNHEKIRYTRGNPEGPYFPVIIKTPTKDGDHYQRIEYSYLKMAHLCGIDVPDTYLLIGEKSKLAFFAIKRFDVLKTGERLHVHTYAGLMGLNFREASPDYSELFRTTADLTKDHSQVIEAYRRMVFNYLGYNNDDHTKNISFVMNKKGEWSLSPAYDIGYSPGRQGFHTMSINGIRQNATVKDFEKIAGNFNVKDWKKIVVKIIDTLKNWPSIAQKNGVPEKYKDIVNHRIKENLKRIAKDLSLGVEI